MNNYHDKYIKYLNKNAKLEDLLNGGGSRYNCNPIKKFSEICDADDTGNGKYNSKESCVNDCENKYIEHQTSKYGLSHETRVFYGFIKKLINEENIIVCVRGGNVLGLMLLQMIDKKYKDDNQFKKYFDEFLTLELIKDWDFAGKPKDKEIDAEYRKKLDKLAKKFNLVPRAKTFILYQTRKPILTEDKALFEIAIRNKDTYSTLELPMTTMEIRVNQYNLKYIFMFANSFFAYKTRKEQFDLDIIRRMIKKINIFIYPYKNGIFAIKQNEFDSGNLSASLIKFIKEYDDVDKNMPQFLAMQIEEPHRIFYRLVQKNIPKAEKLTKFIKQNVSNNVPDWIFDPVYIKKIIWSMYYQSQNVCYT